MPSPQTTRKSATQESFPRRGELYYVQFNPVLGSEQGGNRPALIIQNDIGNEFSQVVIVAALTSKGIGKPRDTDVLLDHAAAGLDLPSRVMLNQIRTIDKRRVGRFIGRLTEADLEAVDKAIHISLGLVDL